MLLLANDRGKLLGSIRHNHLGAVVSILGVRDGLIELIIRGADDADDLRLGAVAQHDGLDAIALWHDLRSDIKHRSLQETEGVRHAPSIHAGDLRERFSGLQHVDRVGMDEKREQFITIVNKNPVAVKLTT